MYPALPILWLAAPQASAVAVVHVVGPGGFGSLAEAVAAAADGDVVEVAPGSWPTDLDLYGRALTIRSTGGSGVTELTGGAGTVMLGVYGGDVVLEGFTLRPAGIRAVVVGDLGQGPAAVTLDDVVFEGAAIPAGDTWYPTGPSLLVDEASSVTLVDATFGGSTPNGVAGGHVGVRAGSALTAERATFNGQPTTFGGAVYVEGAAATFTGSTFLGGAAAGAWSGGVDLGSGGAILALDSALTLEDTTFDGASAALLGGAVAAQGGSLNVVGGAMTTNVAAYGGALACIETTGCAIGGATFEGNAATAIGGAVGVWPGVTATIAGARICDNGATWGGGVGVVDGTLTLTNTVLCGNDALDWGGGLAATTGGGAGSVVVSRNNTWADHTAVSWGAAIGAYVSTVDSTNDLFLGNTAGPGEGAVDVFLASSTVSHALFFGNSGTADAALDATTLVGVDPLLVGWIPGDCAASDLHPTLGSPVVGAGHPGWLDPDGSSSDIGAYGGPDADGDFWTDGDGDGTIDAWDCAPQDGGVGPLLDETCAGVGVDEDCDGLIDAGDPDVVDLQTVFVDADLDGYGDPTLFGEACPEPGLVVNSDDCDDDDPDVHPGATEVAGDGVDQDCDGGDLALPTEPPDTGAATDTGDPGAGDPPGTGPGDADPPPDPGAPDGSRAPPIAVAGSAAEPVGCGCDVGGAPPGWAAIALLIGVLRRKRP